MTNPLYIGNDIRQSQNETLKAVSLQDLSDLIRDEQSELSAVCRRLRAIRRMDVEAYRKAKVTLPFFTGSSFRDGKRNISAFESAGWMILDLDRCGNTIEGVLNVMAELKKDEEIALMYRSPSGIGIKCVFQLETACRDSESFSRFYRSYAAGFAARHALSHAVDMRTHDVSRVSFLAHDPEVHFNPLAYMLKWEKLAEPEKEIHVTLSGRDDVYANEPVMVEVKPERDLTPAIWGEILKKLNPRTPGMRPKPLPYVPDMLNHIRPLVDQAIEEYGIKLEECLPIQYGLKFRFSHKGFRSELNIFYGRKGFSVVISPKRDTHPKLNELTHRLVYEAIFHMEEAVHHLTHFTHEQNGN